jgi:anti-anti-sigma factor
MPHPSDSAPTRIDAFGVRPPPAFEIEASALSADISLLLLRGELDLAAAASLHARVEAMAATGGGMIIDVREVTFIDSSALRELLNARQAVARHGGRLVLSGASPGMQRLLDMTGTAALFDTTATRAQAIRRLRRPA